MEDFNEIENNNHSVAGASPTAPESTPGQNSAPIATQEGAASGGDHPPRLIRGSNGFFYGLTAVLLAGVIALGSLYAVSSYKLNKANGRITSLETNVTLLEGRLAEEQAGAVALQVKLGKAQSDLNASQSQVTALTAGLKSAVAAVTATQASLDRAASDLATAILTSSSQAVSLKKVQDPGHFDTLTEITAWLAKDDTNTNPAYASLSNYSKAFILQVKALRDGYLLPACLDWDSSFIYTWNAAIVGGTVYSIDPSTDTLTKGPAFPVPPPSHPLPIS